MPAEKDLAKDRTLCLSLSHTHTHISADVPMLKIALMVGVISLGLQSKQRNLETDQSVAGGEWSYVSQS